MSSLTRQQQIDFTAQYVTKCYWDFLTQNGYCPEAWEFITTKVFIRMCVEAAVNMEDMPITDPTIVDDVVEILSELEMT